METDIVEKLRIESNNHGMEAGLRGGWHLETSVLLDEAADEIERLRAVVGAMDDPSRTSYFLWGRRLVGGGPTIPAMNEKHARTLVAEQRVSDAIGPLTPFEVVTRTITYTAWRPA